RADGSGAAPPGRPGACARARRPLAAELREPIGAREAQARPLAAVLDGARTRRLDDGDRPPSRVSSERPGTPGALLFQRITREALLAGLDPAFGPGQAGARRL